MAESRHGRPARRSGRRGPSDRVLHRRGPERNVLLIPAMILFVVVFAVAIGSLVVAGANDPGADSDRANHAAACRSMFGEDIEAANACIEHLP